MAAALHDQARIKAFWDKTEAELGERVIVYAMGKGLSGWIADDPRRELWGLFFVTQRALYFRHFRKQHWLSSLTSGSGSQVEGEEFTVDIPLERIRSAQLQRHRSFLKRLLSGSPPQFVIEYRRADGAAGTVRFFVDAKSEAFLNAIESRGK